MQSDLKQNELDRMLPSYVSSSFACECVTVRDYGAACAILSFRLIATAAKVLVLQSLIYLNPALD